MQSIHSSFLSITLPVLLGLGALSACNMYSPLDKPSGDAQILAAARACFDQGDFTCAATHYAEMSPASSDLVTTESIFLALAQNGAPASAFVTAMSQGSSSGGKLLTLLANNLTNTPGEAARLAYFHAYQQFTTIVDTRNQGLVRFVTALAVAAEILSEDAAIVGQFQTTDLVANPVKCLTSMANLSPPTIAASVTSGCEIPAGKKLVTGTPVPSLGTASLATTDSMMSGTPTLYMFNAAIASISDALDLMQTTGSLGAATSAFSDTLLSQTLNGGTGESPYFRGTLLQYGVGAY